MMLRDLYCTECDRDMYNMDISDGITINCPHCGGTMAILCNGGTGGKRYRYMDVTEAWVETQVRAGGVAAEDEAGAALEHVDGGNCHDRLQARQNERHERKRHEWRQARGRNPIMFDTGKMG